MKIQRSFTLCVFAAMLGAVPAYAAGDQGPVSASEAELLVESLRAGLHQWERDVAFKSTYVSRTGRARDLVDAETGDYVPLDVLTQGSGVLIKDGAQLCRTLDFDIGGLRLISPLPSDGSRPRRFETGGIRPVHQLSSAVATLFYQPEIEIEGTPGWTTGGSAHYRESSPGEMNAVAATQFYGFVTPLAPTSKAELPLSAVLDLDAFLPGSLLPDIKRRVYRREGDVVEVVTEGESGTVRLLFWTAPFPPVLKALFKTDDRPTKFGNYEYRSVLSDFRQCRNGLVPARVVTTAKWSELDHCTFKEWYSEDLGNEDPAPGDFVLHLPADAFIGGMTELPPIEDGVRKIRVDGLRQDRIAQLPQNVADIIDPSAPPPAPIARSGAGRIVFLVLFNVLVVCGIAVFLAFSKRQGHAH